MSIPANLQASVQPAWKPIVIPGDRDRATSKFSGHPWLAADEAYPTCPNCGKPMQLLLQLNLAELPAAVQGRLGQGLLQLFYCTSEEPLCECDCDAWAPFATSTLARVIQPEGTASDRDLPPIENYFPPKTIVDWHIMDDFPGYAEREVLGIELTEAEETALEKYPQAGDKLLGYPLWIQGIEYPDCPICGQTMRLVFQLDSEDNLPIMFGDVGCGHITQCATHLDQVAFAWACG